MRASSSSTVSTGTSISTELPSRFMRVALDSIESTVRPFTFSRARSSSSVVTPSCCSRWSSVPITPMRLAHVVRPRAHVQPHLAGVRVVRRIRVDRVGQAALLAHLLEQAGRARAAQHRVQQPQREAPLVAAGDPVAAQAEVVLLRLLGVEAHRRRRLRRARAPATGAAGASPTRGLHQRHEPVVIEVAGGGHDDVVGHVAPVVPLRDLRHRDRGDHLRPADHRPAQRVVAEDRAGQHVVHLVLTARPRTWRSPRSPPGARSRCPGRSAAAPCPGARRRRAPGARRGSASRPRSSPCRCRR